MALPKKLIVVSDPAPRIAKIVSTSSCSVSREPSSSLAVMRSLVDVVAGLGPLERDEAGNGVPPAEQDFLGLLRGDVRGSHEIDDLRRGDPGFLRHPDELGDQHARRRAGEGRLQVDRLAARRGVLHPVEQHVDQLRGQRTRTCSARRELNALAVSLRRRLWSAPNVVEMLSIATQLIISQSGGISPLEKAGQWLRALFAHVRIAQQPPADRIAVDRPGQDAAWEPYLGGGTLRAQVIRLGVNVSGSWVQSVGATRTHSTPLPSVVGLVIGIDPDEGY